MRKLLFILTLTILTSCGVNWHVSTYNYDPIYEDENYIVVSDDVKVDTLKKSTVPKSDNVSIATNDKPAIIAGLAKGRATEYKGFLPLISANSNKDVGVDLKATFVIK